jgi:2-C-methyl-D-erythritol 4-phosphate cytidylyltransferase
MEPLECNITHGKATENMKAGLGIDVNDDLKVVKMTDGQCRKAGVTKGMQITHIGGVPIKEKCLGGIVNKRTFTAVVVGLTKLGQDYTLNFNGVKEKEVEAQPDTSSESFCKLMKQGMEVQKKHQNGNIFNHHATRVLYTDDEVSTIMCGKEKDTPTTKVVSVDEVKNVGVSKKNAQEVVIVAKDSKQNLTIKLPTESSAQMLARKLHRLASDEQEKKYGRDSLISTDSTPVSP